MRWLIACMMVALAFAGCVDDMETTDPAAGDVADDGDVDSLGPGPDATESLMAKAVATETITESYDDSFSHAEQSAYCPTECTFHDYSLTELMQLDTAYFMDATLTQTVNAAGGNPINFRLVYGAGVRDYDGTEADFANGIRTMDATLLAPGEADVSIRVSVGPIVDPEPASYTLDIVLEPIPDKIPQYAPAAVTVPAGGSLAVETQSGDGRVMVYDGEDGFVGVFDITAPEDNVVGNKVYQTTVASDIEEAAEFVVFALDDIWTALYVQSPEGEDNPVLRHLPLKADYPDLGTVDSGGDVSFVLTVEQMPLNIGYRYGQYSCSVPADIASCYMTTRATHRMLDPSGTEILSGSVDGTCICNGFPTRAIGYDVAPHALGDYTIEWSSQESSNVLVQGVLWSYQR